MLAGVHVGDWEGMRLRGKGQVAEGGELTRFNANWCEWRRKATGKAG